MNRIFISSTRDGSAVAHELASRLRNERLQPVLDLYEAEISSDWLRHVLYGAESSDTVLLIVPDSHQRGGRIHSELDKQLKHKLKSRSISVVFLYLGRRRPLPNLNDQVAFFLGEGRYGYSSSRNPEKTLAEVVTYLSNVPKVRFEEIGPYEFERMVVALLKRLSFFEIEGAGRLNDSGFDLLAKTKMRNPFGETSFVRWAIEIKYSKNSRADIVSLQKLSYYLEDRSTDFHGVVITNGQLTSTAIEWIEKNEREKRTSITIVDGVKLRQLVLKHPRIVDEFFGHRSDW